MAFKNLAFSARAVEPGFYRTPTVDCPDIDRKGLVTRVTINHFIAQSYKIAQLKTPEGIQVLIIPEFPAAVRTCSAY